MDEAGNETQQTPHNFDLFSPDSSEKFPWSYYACNRYVGTCVNVDIVGAIRAIEQSSGQQFIWYEDMPEEQVLSWEEYQQAEAERENARRLAEAAAELVQVSRAEAVEQYTVTEMRPVSPTQYVTTTTTVYELDSETGQAVAREVITTEEVTETVEMGLAWRLKEGCQLDSYTGIFKCPVGEENATYEPYELQPMPDWMQDRITTIFLAPKDISGIPRPQGEYKKLVDVGNYSIWWVKAEAETLKELHALLWNMNPKETLGALAAVKTFGESFYDQRVARATGMTVQQFLTRRGKIVNYLKSLGKDTTLLSQATTEHEMVEGIVVALGYTMPQLWNAMR
jgi:hypothetical protein